jgi:hypothetical protein
MFDTLQVMIDQNRDASFAQAALRRRPDVGIKSGLDKSTLNETLGPMTVERDGRCEYQGKRVSNTRKQQVFMGSDGYNGVVISLAAGRVVSKTPGYGLNYWRVGVRFPAMVEIFPSPQNSAGLWG